MSVGLYVSALTAEPFVLAPIAYILPISILKQGDNTVQDQQAVRHAGPNDLNTFSH